MKAKTKTKKRSVAVKRKIPTALQIHQVSRDPSNAVVQGETNLIRQAIVAGAPIDTIERLVALYEREEAKKAFKAFHSDMGKLQASLETIGKNKKGFEGYQYANLDRIVESIRKPVAEHGFTYRYEFKDVPVEFEIDDSIIIKIVDACRKYTEPGSKLKADSFELMISKLLSVRQVEVTCIVTHRDGHSERTTMTGPEDHSGFKNLIQSRGSSMTYLERYTLIGAFGLTTVDTDTDGAQPKKKSANEQFVEATVVHSQPTTAMNDAQFAQFIERLKAGEPGIMEQTRKHFVIKPEQEKKINDALNSKM